MKRCPTCEKTFDDNMRFCQSDGTPLVEDAEPVDPYKTMVARPEDIAAAIPPLVEPPADEQVLEIPPEADANKTQYVSEEELRAEMAFGGGPEEPMMEIPPMAEPVAPEPAAPEPPRFIEQNLSPPPSPFSTPTQTPSVPLDEPKAPAPAPPGEFEGDPFAHTTPPIPSPFNNPQQPAAFQPPKPPAPQFAEPEPPSFIPTANPFNDPKPNQGAQAMAEQQWTPPAAPDASWQNQPIGQNTPFQPPPSGTGGENKTLAIVSLVLGILGLTICCGSLIPSLAAMITGFMARSKASNDPANYGGGGLALGGLITGVVGLILSIAYLIFVFFLGGLQLMMQGMQ
ncbi:MAG: DUF4190 domain-containing protein [Blastocatellia bacterium]